jgi:antitoxin YefM
MKVTTYSKLRQNLAKCMDEVADDHAPMLVTRANGRHAVLMSLEDFAGYEETRYLNSNPANAKRLDEAMADAEAGRNMITFESMEALEAEVRRIAALSDQQAAE